MLAAVVAVKGLGLRDPSQKGALTRAVILAARILLGLDVNYSNTQAAYETGHMGEKCKNIVHFCLRHDISHPWLRDKCRRRR